MLTYPKHWIGYSLDDHNIVKTSWFIKTIKFYYLSKPKGRDYYFAICLLVWKMILIFEFLMKVIWGTHFDYWSWLPAISHCPYQKALNKLNKFEIKDIKIKSFNTSQPQINHNCYWVSSDFTTYPPKQELYHKSREIWRQCKQTKTIDKLSPAPPEATA